MKNTTPKRLYVRLLANGRLSFGEYINAKWRNVIYPFMPNNANATAALRGFIRDFKIENKREVEIEAYRGDTEALRIANSLLLQ